MKGMENCVTSSHFLITCSVTFDYGVTCDVTRCDEVTFGAYFYVF